MIPTGGYPEDRDFRRLLLVCGVLYGLLAAGLLALPHTPKTIEKVPQVPSPVAWIGKLQPPARPKPPRATPAPPRKKPSTKPAPRASEVRPKPPKPPTPKKAQAPKPVIPEPKRPQPEAPTSPPPKPEPTKAPSSVAPKPSPTPKAPQEVRARPSHPEAQEVARRSSLVALLTQKAPELQKVLEDPELQAMLSDQVSLQKEPPPESPAPEVASVVPPPEVPNPDTPDTSLRQHLQETLARIQLDESAVQSVVATPTEGGDLEDQPYRTRDSIARIVASYRGGLDFLYRRALRKNPFLRGTIEVEFVIDPSGEVRQVRILQSTLEDPKFEEQIRRRILQWKFPPLPGGGETVVVYPLEFTPL